VLKLKPDRLLRIEALSDGVACKYSDDPDRQGRNQNRANDSRAWKKQANPGNHFYGAREHKRALSEPKHAERRGHEFHACELRVTGCEKQNTNDYLKGIERDDRHDVPDDRCGRALSNDRL
jgi:hypothetical protein